MTCAWFSHEFHNPDNTTDAIGKTVLSWPSNLPWREPLDTPTRPPGPTFHCSGLQTNVFRASAESKYENMTLLHVDQQIDKRTPQSTSQLAVGLTKWARKCAWSLKKVHRSAHCVVVLVTVWLCGVADSNRRPGNSKVTPKSGKSIHTHQQIMLKLGFRVECSTSCTTVHVVQVVFSWSALLR